MSIETCPLKLRVELFYGFLVDWLVGGLVGLIDVHGS